MQTLCLSVHNDTDDRTSLHVIHDPSMLHEENHRKPSRLYRPSRHTQADDSHRSSSAPDVATTFRGHNLKRQMQLVYQARKLSNIHEHDVRRVVIGSTSGAYNITNAILLTIIPFLQPRRCLCLQRFFR